MTYGHGFKLLFIFYCNLQVVSWAAWNSKSITITIRYNMKTSISQLHDTCEAYCAVIKTAAKFIVSCKSQLNKLKSDLFLALNFQSINTQNKWHRSSTSKHSFNGKMIVSKQQLFKCWPILAHRCQFKCWSLSQSKENPSEAYRISMKKNSRQNNNIFTGRKFSHAHFSLRFTDRFVVVILSFVVNKVVNYGKLVIDFQENFFSVFFSFAMQEHK